MDTSTIRVVELFAGVGGLGAGIRLAVPKSECVLFIEREFNACEVLAARMADGSLEGAPIFTDITQFRGHRLRGKVDILIGGSPCQDLSVAGKRAGLAGARSGLFGEYARLVEEIQPEAVFFENVGGISSSLTLLHHGEILGHLEELLSAAASAATAKERWQIEYHHERLHRRLLKIYGIPALLYVQCCLESMGYRCETGFFSAAETEQSHKRERVFILAYRESGRLRELWQSSGCGGFFDGSGAELADACRDERSRSGWQAGPRRGVREAGDAVDDASDSGRWPLSGSEDCGGERFYGDRQADGGTGVADEVLGNPEYAIGRPEYEEHTDAYRWNGSGRPGSDVGHPDQPGSQGWRLDARQYAGERVAGEGGAELADAACNNEWDGSERSSSAKDQGWRRVGKRSGGVQTGDLGCAFPLFAPGPSSGEWPAILRDFPWLAPAISEEETQQFIRDMAPGASVGLGGNRTDQLRSLGNLASPVQAAFAFLMLSKRAGLI